MRRIRNPVTTFPVSPLVKFSLGSAWGMAGRLVLLCAVAAVALASFCGVYSAMRTVVHVRDGWYEEGGLPDMELRFDEASPDALASLSATEGVDSAVARTIAEGRTDVEGQRDLAVSMVSTPAAIDDQAVGRLVLLQGARPAPDDEDGALVGDELARCHSVGVGDRLSIDVRGGVREVTVRGIVRDSEHLISPVNPSLFVSAKGSMGMVYVPPEDAPANSVILGLDDGQDPDAVRTRVLTRAAELGVGRPYAVGKAEQFDYQYVNKNLDVFRIILPVLVAVGGLSALFVSMFLSAQWVSRARQQVAVLLALGHGHGAVAGSFAIPYALLALVTIALGRAGGLFMGQGFLDTFTGGVGLPRIELVMDPLLVLIGSAAVVLTFAGGAALALRVVFTMSPKEAMAQIHLRHGRRSSRFSRLATGIPWPPLRIATGNLLRTPLVSLVTVLSVAAGFSLTAAFFLSYSNVMTTSTDSVARHEWDVMVDFERPVTTGEAETLMGDHGVRRQQWTPLRQDGGSGGNGGDAHTLLVGGFDPANHWHTVSILQGRDIDVGAKNDVVLESGVARDLGLAPGDSFTMHAAGGSRRVRLVGTMSSALPGEARVPEELGQELSGLGGRMTGVMVRLDGTGPTAEGLAHELGGEGAVQQALTKSGISTLVVQSNDQVTALLWAGALMSILVAGLLVGACLGYTIIGRREEYRLLSIMGFEDRTVRGIVVLESAVLGVLSVLVALPSSLAMSAVLDRRLSLSWFHVNTLVQVEPLLQTFVPGLFFLPLLAVPMAWAVLPRKNLVGGARQIG